MIGRVQSELVAQEAENRHKFLSKLGDALRAEAGVDAQAERALTMLRRHLDLDRCYIGVYRLEEDRGEFPAQVGNDRVPPLPEAVRLSDFPDALRMASESTLVLDAVMEAEGLSSTDRQNLERLGLGGLIAATLRRGERTPLWSIVAVSARPRHWTPGEVALVEAVAEHTWAAIERTRADSAQRASEERYRTLFEAIDAGFCISEVRFDEADGRANYRVLEANPAFYEQTGFQQEVLGLWLRDAVPELEEHWYEIYGRVARSREPVRFEQRSAMLGRWFDVYAFPIDEPQDLRVAILFTDISERKHAEEHQNMLMAELDHRVKNILAVVQAIAKQSLRSGQDNGLEAVDRLVGRINALAGAHALLARSRWSGVGFREVLESAILPYRTDAAERLAAVGPDLMVAPKAAQTLNLVFHELVTNAARYGALSEPGGRVRIDWHTEGRGEEERLHLRWIETGGPPIERAPDRKGFGSSLLEQALIYELDGEVKMDYFRAGFGASISLSIEKMCAQIGIGAAKPSQIMKSSLAEVGKLRDKHVLVVEDEFLVGHETAEALRSAGCKVTGPVGTVAEALRIVVSNKFHAAVLDVNLSGEFVWPVAQALTARGIPLILATGYSDSVSTPMELSQALRVEKPVAREKLISALITALAK